MVWRTREWGVERILLGSDYVSAKASETPLEAVAALRSSPFTEEKLETILNNNGRSWLDGK